LTTTNVLLAGVGGQGTVLAGELLSRAALADGLDVKKSEIHGMSQRGGSVVSHVRFGREVFSPVIAVGEADLLLSFERLEALRYAPLLRPAGMVVLNRQSILPAPVLAGVATYPEEVEEPLRGRGLKVIAVDALELARVAGHPLTANVALLGVVSRYLSLTESAWSEALEAQIKPALLEVNRRAFQLGREAGLD
jgi:indolepyruvate ferredoxin oxidoreductase beta subunit